MAELTVQQADVTQLDVDAIANAANTQLQHGDPAERAFQDALG
ncbi:MAG: hypothetical protein WD844_11465 [Thermoleophilaceae bacterium]